MEKKLIEKIRTEWNRESLQYSREKSKVHTNDHNIDTYSGKYLPLESYLKDSRQDMIEPSFEKIENILSFKLPKSAKKYNAWWSGKKRSHTKAWMGIGNKAQPKLDKKKVFFRRTIDKKHI